MENVTCKSCQKSFGAYPSEVKKGRKYCSRACVPGKPPISIDCSTCGTRFKRDFCLVKRAAANFCSKKCRRPSEETKRSLKFINTGKGNPQFGKKLSEEHKKAIGIASAGNKYALGYRFTQEQKDAFGEMRRGLKRTEETNTKMSVAQKVLRSSPGWVGRFSGEKHWNYISDRSKLKKKQERNDSAYQDWRKSVRDRDGWLCKMANGDCLGKVVAHHILPWRDFVELRYEINNGITLCRFHHPLKRVDEMRLSPYFHSLLVNETKI